MGLARRSREGVEHPFATAPGWILTPPGLSHWISAKRGGHRVDVWLPAYDDVAGVIGASGLDLSLGLVRYEAAVGLRYHHSPGAVAMDLIRRGYGRRRVPLNAAGAVPEIAGPDVEWDLRWWRAPTLEEMGRPYVHSFDLNGMYLAACSSLEVGFGEPEHLIPKHDDAGLAFDRGLVGYWYADVAPLGADLPETFGAGYRWRTTPTMELAEDLGRIVHVGQAWIYPEHHRYLEPFYAKLSNARAALTAGVAADVPGALVALRLVKRTYTIGIGYLGGHFRADGDPLRRPDWRHAVIAKARANIMRRILKLTDRPFAVDVDALYIASPSEDPAAVGLILGDGLGAFKHTGTRPTGAVLEALARPETLRELRASMGKR